MRVAVVFIHRSATLGFSTTRTTVRAFMVSISTTSMSSDVYGANDLRPDYE